MEFKILINIAEEMNDYVEGDLTLITDQESDFAIDFDDMFAAVGINVIQSITLTKLNNGNVEPPDQETIHFITDRMQYIFERLVTTGDFNFLIDPDFIPRLKEYSVEELNSMSEEEQIKYLEQKISLMTFEEQTVFLVSSVTLKTIETKTNRGNLNHISTALREEIIKETLDQEEFSHADPEFSETDEEYIETVKNIVHDLVTEYNNSKTI